MSVVRPLGELDLDDELRLDPEDVALTDPRHFRHLGKRRSGALQPSEALQQLVERPLGESGADVAHPAKLSPLPDCEDERAEPGSPALAPRIAGDDELLPWAHLHLQPVPRAPLLVTRVLPLRHDPLEALLLGCAQQRLAVVERAGQAHRSGAVIEQPLEAPVTLRQLKIEQGFPVDLEYVKDVVDERPCTLLHEREPRAPRLVEGADLAVENAVKRLRRLTDCPGDSREPRREVLAGSAHELGLAAPDVRQSPVAVPLRLEEPLLAGGQPVRRRRQHRLIPLARTARRSFLALPHKQPVLRVAGELGRDERPDAVEALSAQANG